MCEQKDLKLSWEQNSDLVALWIHFWIILKHSSKRKNSMNVINWSIHSCAPSHIHYEQTVIMHHFYVWLFLNIPRMRWWEWWLQTMSLEMYNFTSPKELGTMKQVTMITVTCHSSQSVSLLPSPLPSVCLTAHTEVSSEGKPIGRQAGGDSPHENSSRPPSVKVRGGSPSASWARPWSLALLLAALCLQWTLFWCQNHLWTPAPLPFPSLLYMYMQTLISYKSHVVSLLLSSTCADGS